MGNAMVQAGTIPELTGGNIRLVGKYDYIGAIQMRLILQEHQIVGS
jgi:hypothetical protein